MKKTLLLFIAIFIILGSACFQFYIKYESLANILSLLSKVVFAFSFIYYSLFCIKNKYKVVNFFDILVIAFYGVLMYSSIRNSVDYISVFPSLMKVLAFKFLIEPSVAKGKHKYILKIVALSFASLIFLNFLQLVFAPNIMGFLDGNKVFLISSNHNQFGGIFIPAILAAILYDSCNKSHVLSVFVISICFLSVLIPKSTTSFVSILVLGSVYVFFRNPRSIRLVTWSIVFTTVTFFLIYIIPVLEINVSQIVDYITDSLDKDMTFNGRALIWLNSLAMIVDNPLWGYGLYDRDWSAINISGANSHNLILNLLLQGGIILLIIFIIYVIIVMKKATCIKSHMRIYYTIMLTASCFLLMSQFEVYNYVFILIFLYLIRIFAVGAGCLNVKNKSL